MTAQFWEGDKDTNGLISVNRQHWVPQGRSTAAAHINPSALPPNAKQAGRLLPASLAAQGQELHVLYLDASSKTQPEHEGNLKTAAIVEYIYLSAFI